MRTPATGNLQVSATRWPRGVGQQEGTVRRRPISSACVFSPSGFTCFLSIDFAGKCFGYFELSVLLKEELWYSFQCILKSLFIYTPIIEKLKYYPTKMAHISIYQIIISDQPNHKYIYICFRCAICIFTAHRSVFDAKRLPTTRQTRYIYNITRHPWVIKFIKTRLNWLVATIWP